MPSPMSATLFTPTRHQHTGAASAFVFLAFSLACFSVSSQHTSAAAATATIASKPTASPLSPPPSPPPDAPPPSRRRLHHRAHLCRRHDLQRRPRLASHLRPHRRCRHRQTLRHPRARRHPSRSRCRSSDTSQTARAARATCAARATYPATPLSFVSTHGERHCEAPLRLQSEWLAHQGHWVLGRLLPRWQRVRRPSVATGLGFHAGVASTRRERLWHVLRSVLVAAPQATVFPILVVGLQKRHNVGI